MTDAVTLAKVQPAPAQPPVDKGKSKSTLKLAVPCPISGLVMALADVPLAIFRHGLLGQGVAINPSGYRLVAPFDGKVMAISAACEQWHIRGNKGLELTIQLGMDSHRLMREGMKVKVDAGQSFKRGETLLEFDPRLLREKASSALCFVLTTQTAKLSRVEAHCHTMLAGDEPCMTLHFG